MDRIDSPRGGIRRARYDGNAEWYDAYLRRPIYSDVPNHLARLVGPGSGTLVDAGCGTGIHLEPLSALGWSVVGCDISWDMLRLADERHPVVVQADALRMPFRDGSMSVVVSVLTLTDFDDIGPFFREARRVLLGEGRLILIATHPCFIGPFVEMPEGKRGVAIVHPGYWTTKRVFEGPGIGEGIRSRVGVRHVRLSELVNKLIESGLNVKRMEELGEGTVPWLLGIVAGTGAG